MNTSGDEGKPVLDLGQDDDRSHQSWPNLRPENFTKESLVDPFDNCVAWSTDVQDEPYWPWKWYAWPEGITKKETLGAFVEFFARHGYERCDSGELEPGYEKVVLYAKNR